MTVNRDVVKVKLDTIDELLRTASFVSPDTIMNIVVYLDQSHRVVIIGSGVVSMFFEAHHGVTMVNKVEILVCLYV